MVCTIIYPADFMGGKAQSFLYFPTKVEKMDILQEIRIVFENPKPDGLTAKLKVRLMLIGDIIKLANVEKTGEDVKIFEDFFIVTASSFRPVPEDSVARWMKKTLVERMIGSGLNSKISGEFSKIISGEYAKVT